MSTKVFGIFAATVLTCFTGAAVAQASPSQNPPTQEEQKKKEEDEKKKKEEEQKMKDQEEAGQALEAAPLPAAGARSMGPVRPVPYREALQGSTVPVRLTAEQCQGQTLLALGKAWQCGTDNLLVLGVDMRTAPELYRVVLRDDPGASPVATVQVKLAGFRREKRRPPVVRTDPNVRPAERSQISAALASGRAGHAGLPLTGPFAYPLPAENWNTAKITDVFGFTRVYSADWTDQHKGQDREAPRGTPVVSIGNGVVVLARQFSSEGGLVIIYHGQDVYSLYQHLDKFVTSEGDSVMTGKTIAFSGDSGNVTGPHLHWGVYINGAVVDPEGFAQTMNAALYP